MYYLASKSSFEIKTQSLVRPSVVGRWTRESKREHTWYSLAWLIRTHAGRVAHRCTHWWSDIRSSWTDVPDIRRVISLHCPNAVIVMDRHGIELYVDTITPTITKPILVFWVCFALTFILISHCTNLLIQTFFYVPFLFCVRR